MSTVKTKKPNKTQLKKKAWDAFSLYIRLRDAKRDEFLLDGDQAFCITCGKPYPATGKGCGQAGHFIPGRNNQVLFDERQVFFQCYNCNFNLRGNWVPYLAKMKELWGEAVVQEMLDSHKTVKNYTEQELIELRELYQRKAQSL